MVFRLSALCGPFLITFTPTGRFDFPRAPPAHLFCQGIRFIRTLTTTGQSSSMVADATRCLAGLAVTSSGVNEHDRLLAVDGCEGMLVSVQRKVQAGASAPLAPCAAE